MRVERRIRAVGTGVRAALAVTFALSVLVAHGNAGAAPGDGYVVMATARHASTVLKASVDDIRVHGIGTRERGGRMYEATQSGFWAAAKIGELS